MGIAQSLNYRGIGIGAIYYLPLRKGKLPLPNICVSRVCALARINDHPFYTISELAEEFAITTRTIRFYEDKGMLNPRREGQRRIYSAADRVRLVLILRGRRLGFSVEESRELIDLYDPSKNNKKQLEKYLQKIKQKQLALSKQLNDIRVLQKELKKAEERCNAALLELTS